MKNKYFYGFLSIMLLCLICTGCSDNLDSELIPSSSVTRTLMLNGSTENVILNINAGSATRTIDVESNTRWTVEVTGGSGWCTTDVLSGIGNSSFTIKILENPGERRTCKVTVTAVDAEGQVDNNKALTKDVEIVQGTSDVRLSPSSVETFSANESTHTFDIVANVSWTFDVTYETADTPEFVVVSPIENMTENGDAGYKGTGDARFLITVLANGSNAFRLAFLNLHSEVGDYSVEIVQNKSELIFDVTPVGTRHVGAEGGALEFGVLSHSSWKARCSDSGVTLSPSEGQAGNERQTVTAVIAPNTSRDVQTFTIRFIPDAANYVPQSVEVVQPPFDMTFALSSAVASDVIMETGGTAAFELDSRFNWEIVMPSWISADAVSGDGSSSTRRVLLTVAANTTDANRTATVTISPTATQVAPGAVLEPENLGIVPLKYSVTQFGGRQPAISVPWLGDDYTQTTVNIEFNFYSPFYRIVEAGIEWQAEDDSDTGRLTTVPADPTDCTVSFYLRNLSPATKYVARGYVKDSEGNVKYGNWSYPFTTGGRYPGNEHNPTPSGN